jgi:two-component system, OmpR family, copper resistance phosphate regulon response regulator CusR
MRILVVEDEPRMLELLRKGLCECGFAVMTAADGEAGLGIATSYPFDAIVLDIGLPRRDGCSLMRALRMLGKVTPVLMLTARDTEDDMIRGLDLGADDYLTKPFSFAELVARLQSITRPQRGAGDGPIEAADVVVDPIRRLVTRSAKNVDLTRHEFQLLACLMRRVGECVPRKQLMEVVWGAECGVGASALDVLVNSLRTKIDAPYTEKLIGTVRGAGYIFRQAPAAPGKSVQ